MIIKDPWHCGEYQKDCNYLILKDLKKQVTEIEIESSGKIYTNEINHFYECLIENKIESSKISHSDSYGNAIGLDIWRKSAGVKYDFDKPENVKSSFYEPFFDKNYIIPKSRINSLENKASKLVFGCDNQIDINRAFSMFDYFYSIGGNVFDTAFIYNNGKSDEYLGRWINSRGLENDVIVLGKGAHTPDCYPEVIRDQLLKSLSRLKIDCLDIYCLHRDNKDIPVVVGCKEDMTNTFVNSILPQDRAIIECSVREAALMKISRNAMLAAKVAQANHLYDLCEEHDCSYKLIREFMIDDGTLGVTHWDVPGHDNGRGFGGKCLPKDTSHFAHVMSKHFSPPNFLNFVLKDNELTR